jgi:hypothetical protein
MLGALAPAALNIVGGLLGGQAARRESDIALQQLEAARGQFANIQLPDIEKLRLRPEELLSAGQITPEEYQVLAQLGPSALENIQLDPRLRADQLTALDSARERALQGFTAEDRAMLDQYMRGVTSSIQSQQQAALENAARRGVADSGIQLAAALQGSQGEANRLSQQAVQQAALRVQNQAQNAQNMANLASQIEGRDYSRAADLAQRQDAISQFNQQLGQRVGEQNVQLRNQAQAANLANRQRIQDTNVGLRNAAQENFQQLNQQRFQNELARAQGTAGQLNRIAGEYDQRGQAAANMYGNIAGGAAGGLAAFLKK